jgi:DNA-binding MarR family transcriptional regulator
MTNRQGYPKNESPTGSPDRRRLVAAGSEEPESLLASTGFLLARLGMDSRRRFARMMASHQLSAHHFGLLMALGEHGLLAQQHLSGIMGIDARNSVPIIDELEKRRLIRRQPDPKDRRRYDVSLTPAGHRMMQRLHRDGARLESEMLKPFSEGERASLHRLLLKLFLAIGEEMSGA